MDIESRIYSLYGGNEDPIEPDNVGPEGSGDTNPPSPETESSSGHFQRNFKRYLILTLVLISIVFLVMGVINTIPHRTRFGNKEECGDVYEYKDEVDKDGNPKRDENGNIKQVIDEDKTEKVCVSTDDSYTFEHETGGDRIMRQVKQGFNYTTFVLFLILAIVMYFAFENNLSLKEGKNKQKYKIVLFTLCGIILVMVILSGLAMTGNLFGLEKKANDKANDKMKEDIIRQEGFTKSYNLCLMDDKYDENGDNIINTKKNNTNMIIKNHYDKCLGVYKEGIERDMRTFKERYNKFRQSDTAKQNDEGESLQGNTVGKRFKFPSYPRDNEVNDEYTKIEKQILGGDLKFQNAKEYDNFTKKYNAFKILGLKVETEKTVPEYIANNGDNVSRISKSVYDNLPSGKEKYTETVKGIGEFELDMEKIYMRELENDDNSPREKCITEATKAFEETQAHKDCIEAAEKNTDEKYKTYRTSDEKKQFYEKRNNKIKEETDEYFEDNQPTTTE